MKFIVPLTVCFLTLGLADSLHAQGAPKSTREKLGYALGAQVARALKQQGVDLDPAQFAAAVRDVFSGSQMQMTRAQEEDAITALNKQLQSHQGTTSATTPTPPPALSAKEQEALRAALAKNKKDGDAFLAANRSKPGVQTLPDGMQYKVLKDGTGPLPGIADTVTVKYRGTLINGKEFDNSDQHGGTATFPLNGVIAGWGEALQKMKTGAKWQLYIPSSLAYGDDPVGTDIGPGSTLIFDVELLSIKH